MQAFVATCLKPSSGTSANCSFLWGQKYFQLINVESWYQMRLVLAQQAAQGTEAVSVRGGCWPPHSWNERSKVSLWNYQEVALEGHFMEGARQTSAPRKGGENQPARPEPQEQPTVRLFQQVAEGSLSTSFCSFITLSLLPQNNTQPPRPKYYQDCFLIFSTLLIMNWKNKA